MVAKVADDLHQPLLRRRAFQNARTGSAKQPLPRQL
jgi:hypothetical protein